MLSKPIGRCHCDRNFFAAMTFDVKAFNDLMQATKTDPDEWAYPVSADVEVRANAISASVTALEPISGQSLIAIPYTSHSVIPTVNEPVARSDNARVSRSRRTFSVCGSQHTVVSKAPVAPRRSTIQGNVIHRPYD
jgi:hypothetical protein